MKHPGKGDLGEGLTDVSATAISKNHSLRPRCTPSLGIVLHNQSDQGGNRAHCVHLAEVDRTLGVWEPLVVHKSSASTLRSAKFAGPLGDLDGFVLGFTGMCFSCDCSEEHLNSSGSSLCGLAFAGLVGTCSRIIRPPV